jgi:hypothetical protein
VDLLEKQAGKILDASETAVFKAADTAMSLGAWVVPFCYQREVKRIEDEGHGVDIDREREECIVRGLGQLIIETKRGIHSAISDDQLECIFDAVKPSLRVIQHYDDISDFDPHMASLLERLSPLYDDSDKP